MSRWFLIFLLILPISAIAGIEINGFTPNRFSRGEGRLLTDITQTINTFYGGVTNNENCTSLPANSTCNSCETALDEACNTTAIHDNLIFEVIFTNTGQAGRILVQADDDTSTVTLDFTGFQENIDLGANQQVTIGIQWQEICQRLFGLADCNDDLANATDGILTRRLRLGVDEDDSNVLNGNEFVTEIEFILADIGDGANDGKGKICSDTRGIDDDGTNADTGLACNFLAFPGDSKIFLEDVRTTCDFPDVDGSDADIRFIRVYAREGEGNFPEISNTELISDMEVGDTSATCTDFKTISLENNEFTGLSNGTPYSFSIGVVDQANNVGFVTSPAVDNDIDDDDDDDTTSTSYCFDQNNIIPGLDSCHSTTPAEVIGLFQDEFDCFITTATYGTPFRPKVNDFRQFRNRYLKTNPLGLFVINTYYKVSPPVAKWIRENPQSKKYVRFLLYPFWFFAHLCLHYPWAIALMVLSLITALFVKQPRKANL